MSETPVIEPSAYAQVRVSEPAGERVLGEIVTIGGPGAAIVVPGLADGAVMRIQRRKGVWLLEPLDPRAVRVNGAPAQQLRDLRRHDVCAVGEAQVVVVDLSRTQLKLGVRHLEGNRTVAPATLLESVEAPQQDDADLEIPPGSVELSRPARESRARSARARWALALTLIAVLIGAALAMLAKPLTLDITPGDARVLTPRSYLALRMGDRLLLLPGTHTVRVERAGYVSAQTSIRISIAGPAALRLHLQKLAGELHVDTGGIQGSLSVDGVEAGAVPGTLPIPAGQHTLTIRAPHYLDYVTTLVIAGAGERQDLKPALLPAWGSLRVMAVPAGSSIRVDGTPAGAAPAVIAAPAGVRHIEISAAGLKTWESSVVLRAGTELTVGPVTLGEPDARLLVTSQPAGADVTIAGTHRGRTPLEVSLAAGIGYETVLDLPGHASFSKTVFARAGEQLRLKASLTALTGKVMVRGEPDEAELLIDDTARGNTPQTLTLTGTEHRITVRKQGFLPFSTTLTPTDGLERTIEYRLMPANRAEALLQTAPTLRASLGYELRLLPPGRFQMGSERREQGRRPNEGLREVTLQRPVYFGVNVITNAQFREFRPEHSSGVLEGRSVDLDNMPVTRISWNDAALFSNWLSKRDGLPEAYEQRQDRYLLRRPANTGYRMPTEAEWEYAARYAGSGRFNRYVWGDSLPVPPQVGNLAGAEAAQTLLATLPGYRDDYPLIAPVGQFQPTSLGLHDLSGNVSQWINDYYLSYVEPAPALDPLGPEDGTRHVIRGASWRTSSAAELRLAWRDGADEGGATIGFRLARYAE